MRLGVGLSPQATCGQVAAEAERLGYDVVLVPEGFRSDAASVLGWVAAHTERIGLMSAIFQIPARTPVMTAMTAATINTLSRSRFRLGLGVSNTYISEGWHGVPFRLPLARTREYVDVVRMALSGEPVRYQGRHVTLPLTGDGSDPFRLAFAGDAPRIPIYLAAVGPRNTELAGEIADGWLGVFCSPGQARRAVGWLQAGWAHRRIGRADFDAMVGLPTVINDDVRVAAEPIRAYVARFVSLGARDDNHYYSVAARMGYGDAMDAVQDRYRTGDLAGAAAAVPFDFIDQTSLIGPVSRIADRIAEYADAGITTLVISPHEVQAASQIATLQAIVTGLRGSRLAPSATDQAS